MWRVWVEDIDVYTEYGEIDGKITTSEPKQGKTKNVGKKNEVTPEQDAINMSQTLWISRTDDGHIQ